MRCLTLAEELTGLGANVEFICREHKGNLINLINQKGFTVHILPQSANLPPDASEYHQWLGAVQETDAEAVISVLSKKNKTPDWLIIDHYAIDYKWEQKLRPYVKKIMAIDDLANRKHNCDLLLDQNFYLEKNRYKGLVPDHCVQLLGPQFALLRKEFAEARKNLRERTGEIKRILIFFGGSDNTNQTKKAINAVKQLNIPDIKVDVILGALNPHKEEIYKITKDSSNIFCYENINNMSEFMAKADLAIGAGGSTTWERCCLGLPAIVVAVADNQKELINNMALSGYFISASKTPNITSRHLSDIIDSILSDSKKITALIFRNIKLVDGLGGKKVSAIIKQVEVKH
jgi:UDP-2,4-diacetamido-2,4,6-trideoxy-beta-L-altropyranose hydrolase